MRSFNDENNSSMFGVESTCVGTLIFKDVSYYPASRPHSTDHMLRV